MKTALCMYGKIGGRTGKDGLGKSIDFVKCFESIKKHIIDINNCDVFMHNWNPEHMIRLLDLYKPKKFIIEPQIKFKTTLKYPTEKRDEFICKSRWYSHKKVLEIKNLYEESYGFKYDWVMVCRYDLNFFLDFNFSELKKGFLYASHFNDWGYKGKEPNRDNRTIKERRFLDMWFIASSEFMDKFAGLYDRLDEFSLTDPHRACFNYIASFAGDPLKITRFKFFRWFDYEIDRIIHGSKI